jgi:hypothetical protein
MSLPVSMDDILTRGRRVLTYRRDAVTVNYYINGVTGSDSNDGLTPATALATIDALPDRIPSEVLGGFTAIVNLASNGSLRQTYTADQILLRGGRAGDEVWMFRGGAMVPFVPTTGPSTAALDVVPATSISLGNGSGVATPQRTRFNFVTAAPGWTVNDFAGVAFVRVRRAGIQRYFELAISANTSNTITVDVASGIVGDLLATDTVEIVYPGVRIHGIERIPGTTALLIDCEDGIGTSLGYFGATFERISFGDLFGDLQIKGSPSFDRCQFDTLTQTFVSVSITVLNCAATVSWALQAGILYARVGSRADSPTVPTLTFPGVMLTMFGEFARLILGGVADDASRQGPANVFVSFGHSLGVWGALFDPLIAVGYFSVLRGETGAPVIGDSGGGGTGLQALDGGRVIIDPAVYGVHGNAGFDMKLGTGAAIVLGTAGGNFMEAAGYNGNFTRMLEGTAAAPASDTSAITKIF